MVQGFTNLTPLALVTCIESNRMYLYVQMYLTDKTSDVLFTLLNLMSKFTFLFVAPRHSFRRGGEKLLTLCDLFLNYLTTYFCSTLL